LSPQNPRPQEPSRAAAGGPRRFARGRSARLALLLFAPLVFAQAAARPPQNQTPPRPEPSPTPYVRPRTVAPKEDPARQPTQPQPTQPQPAAPQPTQPAQTTQPPQTTPAQAAPPESNEVVDEDEVVRVDSNLVIIPASVVDARGRAVTDLRVEDFELKVDGEVKPIGELTRAETPVHVALLFDNSASLSAAREFEKQAAVRFFRSVVRPIDRAAVYSISTVPTLAQGLTNDVPRLVRTIERFGRPDGATALFDAVAQASEYMRPLVGRKVLVLVSDGTDTVSDASFDDAVTRALRAECQVYVVQTRQVEDPNLHDPVSEQRMYRLSEQTGGAVFIPQTVEELDAVFTQISLDLSQQYLLSYYPQDERKDKYFRFISLRVKTRPSLRVRARKGFYPDAAQAPPQGGGPSQFHGAQTLQPQTAARPPATQAAAPGDATATYRRTAAAAPPRPGPDGPAMDEDARPRPAAAEAMPTFTLTTSAPTAAPKPPEAAGLFAVADERTAAGAPPTTNTPTRTPPPPVAPVTATAKNESGSRPFPTTPAAEKGDAKGDANDEAKGEAKAAASSSAAPPPRPDAQRPPVSGGVLNGQALSLPRPSYPAAARSYGASGKVVVEVTIDERGRIVEARAVSGHPTLQQAAVQAARLARFSPATLAGEPVRIKGVINYVFSIP
jgi:Ca-activated chloride channel family protein